mmetsp:Transcript_11754/g.35832  ORF Transcript_11754/g.35832 Transcript_11754/m.35832 type:complete len:109 (+) Transcript_11754:236-562(+)
MFSCRMCRRELFQMEDVYHGAGVETAESDSKQFRRKKGRPLNACTSLFLREKPSWNPPLDENSGRLDCPNCSNKLGSFAWSGTQCSCGKWLSPAFQISASKVDHMRAK